MGGSSITTRPSTALTKSQQHIPTVPRQVYSHGYNRYTPTYQSNAFNHTGYVPPTRPETSAASLSQKKVGTSIEDYGRRSEDAFHHHIHHRNQKVTEAHEDWARAQAIMDREAKERAARKEKMEREWVETQRRMDEEKKEAFRRKAQEHSNRDRILKHEQEIAHARAENAQVVREEKQHYSHHLE